MNVLEIRGLAEKLWETGCCSRGRPGFSRRGIYLHYRAKWSGKDHPVQSGDGKVRPKFRNYSF